MATAEEIADLRELIAEPDASGGWTDVRLERILDANVGDDGTTPNMDAAAAHVWTVKAADMSMLVDVSENGSSRKLSDLYKNATTMAAHFRAIVDSTVVVTSDRPRTRAIIRP